MLKTLALANILRTRIKDGSVAKRGQMVDAYDKETQRRSDRTLVTLPDGREMPLRWLGAMLGASPNQTFAENIASFADFLENCGGFKIW